MSTWELYFGIVNDGLGKWLLGNHKLYLNGNQTWESEMITLINH